MSNNKIAPNPSQTPMLLIPKYTVIKNHPLLLRCSLSSSIQSSTLKLAKLRLRRLECIDEMVVVAGEDRFRGEQASIVHALATQPGIRPAPTL